MIVHPALAQMRWRALVAVTVQALLTTPVAPMGTRAQPRSHSAGGHTSASSSVLWQLPARSCALFANEPTFHGHPLHASHLHSNLAMNVLASCVVDG